MVVVDPKYTAKTERLLIRPLRLDDAEDVLLMRKDPEVMKHTYVRGFFLLKLWLTLLRPLVASDDLQKTKDWIQGCHERGMSHHHSAWSSTMLKFSDNNWNFSVELLPDINHPTANHPRVIGLIGAVRTPEVGYMFNTAYWGHGYATEALRAFMPMFFEHFSNEETGRYDYALALTDTELVASQNVLQKAGFRWIETKEKDFENPVLGLRNTMFYRMERGSAP